VILCAMAELSRNRVKDRETQALAFQNRPGRCAELRAGVRFPTSKRNSLTISFGNPIPHRINVGLWGCKVQGRYFVKVFSGRGINAPIFGVIRLADRASESRFSAHPRAHCNPAAGRLQRRRHDTAAAARAPSFPAEFFRAARRIARLARDTRSRGYFATKAARRLSFSPMSR
jgi:hypothetical protein